jgi:hypothetical protein
MRATKLETAIIEAKRFLERAETLLNIELETEDHKGLRDASLKERSAVKRSSMDLTRALADMRKK